jgi:hypothetical protein
MLIDPYFRVTANRYTLIPYTIMNNEKNREDEPTQRDRVCPFFHPLSTWIVDDRSPVERHMTLATCSLVTA